MERGKKKIAGRPDLSSFHVGALPVLNHFLARLGMTEILESFLPASDRRRKLHPARALVLLVRNLLTSREPLYGVGRWASAFEPSLLGLSSREIGLLNDDRIGRALEDLFDADRPSLILRIVVQAVREFGLKLDQFHNDSTSISFEGAYRRADGRTRRGKPTLKITYGHSKDHRPDLRQLLWSLTVTADGTVPVNYQVFDGNTNDDTTHRQTWDVLVAIAGRANFLYVADSKLCTRPNMTHIAFRGGRFLTVLPATRKEDSRFRDWMQTHDVPWQEVFRRASPRKKKDPPDVFRAYEDPTGSAEGFRLVWYHSTEKEKRDRQERENKIDRAIRELQDLKDRLASSRTRFRRREKVDEAIESILEEAQAGRWLEVQVEKKESERFTQTHRGRPGPDTPFLRKIKISFDITWKNREEALRYDLRTDGIFPLITNDRDLDLRRILLAYKLGQPGVEQRHHNLKGFHEVAPQYLKSVVRIEAFLCVYFLALLVNALIEREIRRGMKKGRISQLAIYPEDRPCKRPTTEQLLRVFEDVRLHRVQELHPRGTVYLYPPQLTPLEHRILRLLGVPLDAYRFA
jgi:transposase